MTSLFVARFKLRRSKDLPTFSAIIEDYLDCPISHIPVESAYYFKIIPDEYSRSKLINLLKGIADFYFEDHHSFIDGAVVVIRIHPKSKKIRTCMMKYWRNYYSSNMAQRRKLTIHQLETYLHTSYQLGLISIADMDIRNPLDMWIKSEICANFHFLCILNDIFFIFDTLEDAVLHQMKVGGVVHDLSK